MTFRNLREIGTIFVSAVVNQIFFRKNLPLNSQAIEKILIVKIDHIGDVLLATPAFRNLHEHYPEAKIDFLSGAWSRQIVENIPYIDRVWEYNSPFFCRSSNKTSLFNSIKLSNQIRKRNYDLIVELRGDLFTAVISPFSSRYRIDRATLQIKGKFFRPDLSRSKHEVDRNLHLLEHHGIPIKTMCREPGPSEARSTRYRQIFFDVLEEKPCAESLDRVQRGQRGKRWADSFLRRLIGNSGALVAIHPGSPVVLKRWSSDNFAELADCLIEEKQVKIIFVGTEDEKPIVDEIQSKMRHDSINLAGQTDLQELGAILQNCLLFIGNDSAPMHISSAVGTRTIGLFGPGSPERFGPYGEHCRAIRKTDCPPCMAEKCKHGIRCVDKISVRDVMQLIG